MFGLFGKKPDFMTLLQLLRTDLPPGADRTDTKSRISAAGGKGDKECGCY